MEATDSFWSEVDLDGALSDNVDFNISELPDFDNQLDLDFSKCADMDFGKSYGGGLPPLHSSSASLVLEHMQQLSSSVVQVTSRVSDVVKPLSEDRDDASFIITNAEKFSKKMVRKTFAQFVRKHDLCQRVICDFLDIPSSWLSQYKNGQQGAANEEREGKIKQFLIEIERTKNLQDVISALKQPAELHRVRALLKEQPDSPRSSSPMSLASSNSPEPSMSPCPSPQPPPTSSPSCNLALQQNAQPMLAALPHPSPLRLPVSATAEPKLVSLSASMTQPIHIHVASSPLAMSPTSPPARSPVVAATPVHHKSASLALTFSNRAGSSPAMSAVPATVVDASNPAIVLQRPVRVATPVMTYTTPSQSPPPRSPVPTAAVVVAALPQKKRKLKQTEEDSAAKKKKRVAEEQRKPKTPTNVNVDPWIGPAVDSLKEICERHKIKIHHLFKEIGFNKSRERWFYNLMAGKCSTIKDVDKRPIQQFLHAGTLRYDARTAPDMLEELDEGSPTSLNSLSSDSFFDDHSIGDLPL